MIGKIFIVEDDPSIIKTLQISLPLYDLDPYSANTIANAKERFVKSKYDLIILDVNLPDGNGFDFCQYIRSTDKEIPILMLTSETHEKSAVKGFSLGVDDYVRKPFGIEELVQRIKRLLSKAQKCLVFEYQSLKLDMASAKATVADHEIELTKTEFKILELLIRRPEQIVSREEFLDFIGDDGQNMDRSIDTYISRLRRKISGLEKSDFEIKAKYGIGYRLESK